MKKRMSRSVYLILIIVFAVAAVLLTIFLTDTGVHKRDANIVLPGHDAESEHSGEVVLPRESTDGGEQISVNLSNVLSVIRAMRRPENYYLEIQTTVYSGDKSRSADIKQWVTGESSLTRRSESGEKALYIMRASDEVRMWYEDSSEVYTGALADLGADDAAGIKTYEDLLAQKGELVSASYTAYEDYSCIFVLARDTALGYLTEYYVDVDTGLLVGCNTKKNGETVYSMTVSEIGDDVSGMENVFSR